MAIPLSTGGWAHRIVQGLLALASGFAETRRLWDWLGEGQSAPTSPAEVILGARNGYLAEVADRGLELGAQESLEESWTAQEQAALIEAFGWAYERVRLPHLLAEYEVVSIEQEEFTLLSGDVGQASRADAVLRRRSDGLLFVYQFKTSGNPGDARWEQSFQVDMQMMTETLAVERRIGERVWGVLIDAFDKGQRVTVNAETLKERPKEGEPTHEAQRSKLIYGYRTENNPPVQKALYDWDGTTKKGWYKFAVWLNDFSDASRYVAGMSPVEYWVQWLPVEVVEAQFKTLEPIMRDERATEAKVRQIVALEQHVRERRLDMDTWDGSDPYGRQAALDMCFPQNERSCWYPSKCAMFAMCHEAGVADDPEGSGLYRPRTLNHPVEAGE